MTLQEHKDYLKVLEKELDSQGNTRFGLAIPKKEGAYYFGEGISFKEYVRKYKEVISKELK